MNRYRITYTCDDMPKGYIGTAEKVAKDKRTALGFFCGTKPDKRGVFRRKRGGIGRIIEVLELPND